MRKQNSKFTSTLCNLYNRVLQTKQFFSAGKHKILILYQLYCCQTTLFNVELNLNSLLRYKQYCYIDRKKVDKIGTKFLNK